MAWGARCLIAARLRAGLEARLDGHLEDLLRRPFQCGTLARDLELLRAAAVEVLEAAAERDLDDGPLEPLALAPRAARAAEEVAHAAEAALARGPLPRKARAEELREHLGRVAAELVAHAAARRRPGEARRRARATRRRLGVGLVGRPGPALEALDAVDVVDLALLRIAQHVVGLRDLLEFLLGLLLLRLTFRRVLVRVPLHGRLAVRLLQRRVVGFLVDA